MDTRKNAPLPIKVDLQPHDPRWKEQAETEGEKLKRAIGPCLVAVHHIGSTAIPGIHAKPILDLIPEVSDIRALDGSRPALEALGYEWWGELGLPGRRYCTKNDKTTGRRIIQIHCYATGSSEITRHLAFRDYLRKNPTLAAQYNQEKARCQLLHPGNSHAYGDCKDEWIKKIETDALASLGSLS